MFSRDEISVARWIASRYDVGGAAWHLWSSVVYGDAVDEIFSGDDAQRVARKENADLFILGSDVILEVVRGVLLAVLTDGEA